MGILSYTIDDLINGSLPESVDVTENTSENPTLASSFIEPTSPSNVASGESVNQISMVDGYLQSGNFISGSTGWRIDADGNLEANNGNFRGDISGATGTFTGTVTVGSINIGGDDATSAHIDTDGNFWTGASVANKAIAPARISNAGAAVFTNVEIGGDTVQYVITNSGIFSFGDGSDGNLTTTGNVTLTSDKYYDNLTIATGHTFYPAGYRVFVKNILTIEGTGKIDGNGNAGGAGGGGTNGTAGAGTVAGGAAGAASSALADGYLKGCLAGVAGKIGGVGGSGASGVAGVAGDSGSNTTNSLGSNGSSAGAGGAGGSGTHIAGARAGGAGSAGGSATAANVKLIANWHLATLLDVSSTGATVKFNNSA